MKRQLRWALSWSGDGGELAADGGRIPCRVVPLGAHRHVGSRRVIWRVVDLGDMANQSCVPGAERLCLARLGEVPVHRLKAWLNAPGSEYPSR